jgi:hypothetical protein
MKNGKSNTLTPTEFQRLKESFQRRCVQDPDMSHACLRVGFAISWHMNSHTGEAWPGTNAIIKTARVGKNTVPRAIEYLVEKGHVVAEKARGKVTRYYPQPSPPEAITTPIALGVVHATPTSPILETTTPHSFGAGPPP